MFVEMFFALLKYKQFSTVTIHGASDQFGSRQFMKCKFYI